MKVSDILINKEFELVNDQGNLNNEVSNLFASDLMSHVMGFAEENNLLITVLNNINVLGVASLLDFSGVVFSHNVKVNQGIIDKANELNIPLLRTKKTTVGAVIALHEMGI